MDDGIDGGVSREAAAGAAVYSRLVLALYDLEVLKLELPVVFKCSAQRIVDLEGILSRNFSSHSVEVVGSMAFFTGRA